MQRDIWYWVNIGPQTLTLIQQLGTNFQVTLSVISSNPIIAPKIS